MPSVRIWHQDLAFVPDNERLPLSALTAGNRHVHGELLIEFAGRLVPGLGYWGPNDVCLACQLVRGGERNQLTIHADGRMLVTTNGSEPVCAHWVAFVNQGSSFLLWGADGRYRLVIPRRALTQADLNEIADRVGVELAILPVGAEARARGDLDQPRQ